MRQMAALARLHWRGRRRIGVAGGAWQRPLEAGFPVQLHFWCGGAGGVPGGAGGPGAVLKPGSIFVTARNTW